LLDIVHADQKLYLVFEFLDVDLKRYMENGNSQGTPLSLELCRVRPSIDWHVLSRVCPCRCRASLTTTRHFFVSVHDRRVASRFDSESRYSVIDGYGWLQLLAASVVT
jgi:hypothetical protein